jgi:hypothetical protein
VHGSVTEVSPFLRLHHFQPRIKLVSASRTPDAIRLHREFVGTNPHAATIRTPGEVNFLIIHRFVLHSV